MTAKIIIGTRGSDLALWQANYVKSQLDTRFPERSFEIKIIKTTGDQIQETALSKIGDKGLFTRQIENQLLSGEIDLAVHSLKDLQTAQPEGLAIGAVCERELPNDVLISHKYENIEGLPQGAKIATGSLRRRSQLKSLRPDIDVVEIRGNVPTRIEKFLDSDLDGMILAYAGLFRLGLRQDLTHQIPVDVMIPAVGQGAVAIEVRSGDEKVADLVAALNHGKSAIEVRAERAFLRRLEGGCQVPIGANANFHNGIVNLTGVVGSLDGTVQFRESGKSSPEGAQDLGVSLAEKLIAMGAEKLLDEARLSQAEQERVL
jgi:hydroxymethylbilane synthase